MDERMNWADWAVVALALPLYVLNGVAEWLGDVTGILHAHSEVIDDRRRVRQEMHESIEMLTRGD